MIKIDYSDLLGKPFRYHARGPDAYDCYGLAIEVCRRAGIELPPWESVCQRAAIHSEIEKGKKFFRELEAPKPFCLITFKLKPPNTSHIGVMLGDYLHFIHTMEKIAVAVEPFRSVRPPYWWKRATGFWELAR